jgi:DNA-binding response OmpR family regulator
MNKSKLILIVEDELALQEAYKIILSSQGYHIVTANNGAEGLLALKKFEPDLVLLDIFMPVMDGKEFLKNFNNKDYPTTKVIVYSNLSDQTVEVEVIELGADKYVLKSSMTPSDLVNLVSQTIG